MWKNNEQEKSAVPKCSFCCKGQDLVNRLTAGPGEVYICDECVDFYREHIEKIAGSPITMEKITHVCTSCGICSPASHRYCYNCGNQFYKEE